MQKTVIMQNVQYQTYAVTVIMQWLDNSNYAVIVTVIM